MSWTSFTPVLRCLRSFSSRLSNSATGRSITIGLSYLRRGLCSLLRRTWLLLLRGVVGICGLLGALVLLLALALFSPCIFITEYLDRGQNDEE